jgi:hypothetical protein
LGGRAVEVTEVTNTKVEAAEVVEAGGGYENNIDLRGSRDWYLTKNVPFLYQFLFHSGSLPTRFGGRGGHENNIDPGGSRDWEAEKAMKITLTQEVADIGRPRCGSHRGHKYQSGGGGGRGG